jgi:hypothetical protein
MLKIVDDKIKDGVRGLSYVYFYSPGARMANTLASVVGVNPLLFIGQHNLGAASLQNQFGAATHGPNVVAPNYAALMRAPIEVVLQADPGTLGINNARVLSALDLLRRQIHPRTMAEVIVDLAATIPGFSLHQLVSSESRVAMPMRFTDAVANITIAPHIAPLNPAVLADYYYMGNEPANDAVRFLKARALPDFHINPGMVGAIRNRITTVLGGPVPNNPTPVDQMAQAQAAFELLLATSRPDALLSAINTATGAVDLSSIVDTTSQTTSRAYANGLGGNFLLQYFHLAPYLKQIRDILDLIFSPLADAYSKLVLRDARNMDDTITKFHAELKQMKLGVLAASSYQSGPTDSLYAFGASQTVQAVPQTLMPNLAPGENFYGSGLASLMNSFLTDGVLAELRALSVVLNSGILKLADLHRIDSALYSGLSFQPGTPIVWHGDSKTVSLFSGLVSTKTVTSTVDAARQMEIPLQTVGTSGSVMIIGSQAAIGNIRQAYPIYNHLPELPLLDHPADTVVETVNQQGLFRFRNRLHLIEVAARDAFYDFGIQNSALKRFAPFERIGYIGSPDQQLTMFRDEDEFAIYVGYRDAATMLQNERLAGRFTGLDQNTLLMMASGITELTYSTLVSFIQEQQLGQLLAYEPFSFAGLLESLPPLAFGYFSRVDDSAVLLADALTRSVITKDIASAVPVGPYDRIIPSVLV